MQIILDNAPVEIDLIKYVSLQLNFQENISFLLN